MNKKELTEAIEKGILRGFWKPILYFIIGILIVELVFVGIIWYGNSHQSQQAIGEAQPSCAPYKYLNCKVLVGNDSETFFTTGFFSVCGYNEANAYYEQMKPWIEQELKQDKARSNYSAKIRWMECN